MKRKVSTGRKICMALTLLLLLSLLVPVKLFFLGEPVDGHQLHCKVTEHPDRLELQVMTVDSAVALKGWKLRESNGALHLTGRKVLVSSFHTDGSYRIDLSPEGISALYVGGRQVWPEQK